MPAFAPTNLTIQNHHQVLMSPDKVLQHHPPGKLQPKRDQIQSHLLNFCEIKNFKEGLTQDWVQDLNRLKDPVERNAAFQMLQLAHRAPGAPFREVLRSISTGELRSRKIKEHLIRAGALVEEAILGALRIYPGYIQEGAARRQIVALRDLDAARLYVHMQGPENPQSIIIRDARGWGWRRGKTRRILEKLEWAGLAKNSAQTSRHISWHTFPLSPLIDPKM